MTISAVAVPDGVPPRVDVSVAIPAGAVMDSVAVYRSTPTGRELLRQQPSEGFDSRTVSDFEMPYEIPLVYSWESSYIDPTGITAVWSEAWADLSAWTVVGLDWSVSGGKLVWSGADDPTASVSRALTPGRYRIVLAAAPVGVQFVNFGELLFDVAASRVSAAGQAVTIVPGTGTITIDVTPSAVTVTTTAGVYSMQVSVVLTQVAFVGAVASLVALSSVQVPLGTGVGESQSEPFFMAADDSGNLFIPDASGARVLVYDFDGNYVTSFGAAGSGDGQFQAPIHAVTTDGVNVFVADGLVANAQTPRIQKFVPSAGTWVYNTKVGAAGTGNGQFGSFVGGLSAVPGGDVYATDPSNHRVQRFSNALVYEAQTGTNGSTAGKFIYPGPVAVFGAKVAVGDSTGRVQFFSLALAYDQTIPQGFSDGSIYRPLSMAGDDGVLYVISAQSLPTRGGPSRLSKLSESGTYLGGVLNVGTVETDDPEGSGEYPNAVAVRPSTRDVAVLTRDGLVRRYSQPAASIDDVSASGYGTTILVAESSSPVTISPADAWIIHPSRTGISFPVSNDVTGPITSFFGDFGSIDNEANSTVHEILGTDRPVVTTSGPRGSDQLTVTVVTETRDRELALFETLKDQTPLLIRVPPSWGADFADGFYSVGTVTRDRVGATFRHLRSFILPLTAVESPDVTVQNSGWSWAALAAEFPTWADVQATFATWSDVATNTRQL